MKGHELDLMRRLGYPVDTLFPDGLTVARPFWGADGPWRAALIHGPGCTDDCEQSATPVLGTTLEPHTSYQPCPELDTGTAAALTDALDVVHESVRHLNLLDRVWHTTVEMLEAAYDEGTLAAAGANLRQTMTEQVDAFTRLRRELAEVELDRAAPMLAFLTSSEEQLRDLRAQFAERWWSQLDCGPTQARLTLFDGRWNGTDPDEASACAAAHPVAQGTAAFFVGLTPDLTGQCWWELASEADGTVADLGPAGQTLSDAAWATFFDMCTTLDAPPKEAFDALLTAGT